MRHANWKCPKCGTAEFRTSQLRAASSGLASIFDIEDARFTTVSCTRCRYTELYQVGADGLENVLDLLAS